MVRSIDSEELQTDLTQIAYRLADAHAEMTPSQRETNAGQLVFEAKQIAYALLRKVEHADEREMFKPQTRWQRLRGFFSRWPKARCFFSV